MSGPRPTPTRILQLRGSWRAKLRDGEPQPRPAIPTCPRHLDREARREWHRVTKVLRPLQIISEADRAILSAYCSCWGRLHDAESKLHGSGGLVVKSPSGYPMLNPYLSVVHRSVEQLQRLASELGLSPAARTRIRVPVDPAAESDDPFADLGAAS